MRLVYDLHKRQQIVILGKPDRQNMELTIDSLVVLFAHLTVHNTVRTRRPSFSFKTNGKYRSRPIENNLNRTDGDDLDCDIIMFAPSTSDHIIAYRKYTRV